MINSLLLALVLGYLLGSIPFAHIIARKVGNITLSDVGSRNVGTRNLSRSVGQGWGVLGAVLDFSKGVAAMALGQMLAGGSPAWLLAGTAAVAGHNWPVWLRGRGGKGLATALGAAAWLVAWPEVALVIAAGWLVMRWVRNITLTAILCFAVMLVALQFNHRPADYTYFVLSLALMVLLASLPDVLPKQAAKRG